jgi:predicted RNA-binding Zn-ribbon protein involved in translation (DUF1610 family)
VVDHLEPYRQMVRSIRFVPPIWDSRSLYQHLTEPAPNAPVWQPLSIPASSAPNSGQSNHSEPPINSADRAEALIRAAVSQPTVLPTVYVIQENIGDRISKLTADQPRPALVLPPPKIPTPDPNWVPPQAEVHPVHVQDTEIAEPHVEASSSETQHPERDAVSSSPIDLVPVSAVIATSSQATSPTEIETEPATSKETESTNPISSWFQSVTTYLEGVTQKLEANSHPPTDSAAIAQTTTEDANLGSECPECGSTEIRKNGRRNGKQKYLCKSCSHQFIGTQTEPVAAKSSKRKRAKGFGTSR